MKSKYFVETFPPGEFLVDELDARGWTHEEFTDLAGWSPEEFCEVVSGDREITPDLAEELAFTLGTSAQFWLNLEAFYKAAKLYR